MNWKEKAKEDLQKVQEKLETANEPYEVLADLEAIYNNLDEEQIKIEESEGNEEGDSTTPEADLPPEPTNE